MEDQGHLVVKKWGSGSWCSIFLGGGTRLAPLADRAPPPVSDYYGVSVAVSPWGVYDDRGHGQAVRRRRRMCQSHTRNAFSNLSAQVLLSNGHLVLVHLSYCSSPPWTMAAAGDPKEHPTPSGNTGRHNNNKEPASPSPPPCAAPLLPSLRHRSSQNTGTHVACS